MAYSLKHKEAPKHTGVYLAAFLAPDEAGCLEQAAAAGGVADEYREAVEDIHLTLAYLGEYDPADEDLAERVDRLVDALASFSAAHAPLIGSVSGQGAFSSESGGKPFIALPDLPTLPALRAELVELLSAIGLPANTLHGYTPHITLAYLPAWARIPTLDLGNIPPLRLDTITLIICDDRIEYPLTGFGDDDGAVPCDPVALRTATPATRASNTGDKQTDDENDLVASFVGAYEMSQAQTQALGVAIYTARLSAYETGYAANAQRLGVELPADWQPDRATMRTIAEQSLAAAIGVAATYRADLMRFAYAFIRQWEADHNGSTMGALSALNSAGADWAAKRAAWKAEQIGSYEAQVGYQQGAQDLIGDLLDGDLTNADGETLDLSSFDTSGGVYVAVVPDASSADMCADFAGNVYPIDAYDDLPDFPAHIGCIHEIVLILGSELSDFSA